MPKARSKTFLAEMHLQTCLLAAKQRNLMACGKSQWIDGPIAGTRNRSVHFPTEACSHPFPRGGPKLQTRSAPPASSGLFCKCCLCTVPSGFPPLPTELTKEVKNARTLPLVPQSSYHPAQARYRDETTQNRKKNMTYFWTVCLLSVLPPKNWRCILSNTGE